MPRSRRSRRKQRQAVNPLRARRLSQVSRALAPSVVAQIGVLLWGSQGATPSVFGELPVTVRGEPSLPYELTLLWKPGLKASHAAIMRGFSKLLSPEDIHQAWEVLAMLVDRNLLAASVGVEAERTRTLDKVGDLRLPVYDVRMLWVRRTDATKRVVASWASEVGQGADEQHAFLRALYKERAMLCTLPPGWHTQP